MNSISEELLLKLSDCSSLSEINVLSLRGKGLHQCLKIIASCPNLLILYLQGNQLLFEELHLYLPKFQRIQKLDLSSNQLKHLPDASCFSSLAPTLQILYLHDNMLFHWNDLSSLSLGFSNNSRLVHLTLMRNPISHMPGYRHFLVNSVPSLLLLDEFVVTDEEKVQGASLGARFRAMGPFMKIHIPYFQENLTAEQHLFNLGVDLYRIKRLFERNSPAIKIQAWFRGYKVRKQTIHSYGKKKQAATKIQKVVRGWLFRHRVQRDLRMLIQSKNMGYLLLNQQEYKEYRARQVIENAICKFVRKRREEKLQNYCATLIQKFWKGKFAKHTSYIETLRFHEDSDIYILKEQKQEFLDLLRKTFPQEYSRLSQCLYAAMNFQILRYPNPLTFKSFSLPILTLIMPTLSSRVKFFKRSGFTPLISNGGSLANIYTRFIGMAPQRARLSLLQNRLCHVNFHEKNAIYSIGVDHRGSGGGTVRKAKKQFDNYQELLRFKSRGPEMTAKICAEMIAINQKENRERLMLFFPVLMKRVSAVICVQQSFRSYLIRKEQKRILESMDSGSLQRIVPPACEATIYELVLKRRAIICICQYWKYFKMKWRLNIMSDNILYVHRISPRLEEEFLSTGSARFYIEELVYLRFESIFQRQFKQLQLPTQRNSLIDFYPCEHRPGCFEVALVRGYDPTGRYLKHVFPQWMLKFLQPGFTFGELPQVPSRWRNDYLGLIHLEAGGGCRVLDYNEIVDPNKKTISLRNGLKFVEVTFCSVQELQKRLLILTMLTSSFRSPLCLRPFTKQMLEEGMFIQHLIDYWAQHDLQDGKALFHKLSDHNKTDHESLQEQRNQTIKQRAQQHNGIILSSKVASQIDCSHSNVQVTTLEKLRKEALLKNKGIRMQIMSQATRFKSKSKSSSQNELIEQERDQSIIEKPHIRELRSREIQARKQTVMKTREINQAMKEVVKFEQDASIRMFQKFTQQEKKLFEELKEKEELRRQGEALSKRSLVLKQVQKRRKDEADREFVQTFNQVKNIISKQSKLGEIMKLRTNTQRKNQGIVKQVKESEKKLWANSCQVSPNKDSQSRANAIPTKLYDSGVIRKFDFEIKRPLPMHSFSQQSSPVNRKTSSKFQQNRMSDAELPNLSKAALNNSALNSRLLNERRKESLQQISSKFEITNPKGPESVFGKAWDPRQQVNSQSSQRKSRFLNRMTFIEESYPMDFNRDSQFH